MNYKANIELCEMSDDKKAGRVNIKMSALTIHQEGEYNLNGITWLEEYVEANIDSIIGAPYVVSWLVDKEIPSNHGTMSYDDEGNAQFEGESVGTIQKAYVDTVEIDGQTEKRLVTEGYLFKQRIPKFIKFLKEKIEVEGEHIKGSIEINGKGDSKEIEYLEGRTNNDGTLKIGRIPTVFDFTGLAILYLETPADSGSEIIELNSKEGNELKKGKINQKVELNELSYDDIATLVTRAFNKIMREKDGFDCYYRYWIYKFYPTSNRVILYDDSETPYKYFMTTYDVSNDTVTIGETTEVEQTWTPVDSEVEVEINTSLIKNILNNTKKEDNQTMENQNSKNGSVVELNNQIVEKVNEINTLTQTIQDKDVELNSYKEKEVELNQLIVEANKTIESLKAEVSELNSEIKPLRELKETQEKEKAQAEINSYFETIKAEDGFSETELNSLKIDYVDKGDLEGLKVAEQALCVQKFKEMKKVDRVETEINSVNDGVNLFFSTKIETLETNASKEDGSDLFA